MAIENIPGTDTKTDKSGIDAAADRAALAGNLAKVAFSLADLSGRSKDQRTLFTEMLEAVAALIKKGVDLAAFDQLLTHEMDRRLKRQFGWIFTVLAVAFALVSYLVVILDATLHWGIPQYAITGLVIETPIQFFGLLFIIARNLFPQPESTPPKDPKVT